VTAGGKILYDVGNEFDEANDIISIGTGATGDALVGLNDSMKRVYRQVPAEMSDAASAVSDYNTRLGLTGDTLETMSVQALQVSRMLNEDLGTVIEKSSTAMQQWGVAENDMTGVMDYVYKVSQSTGMGFTTIFSDLQTYGAQLQELGYGIEDGAALLGQLEKRGVNVNEVMAAMKRSVGNMADEGISAADGMTQYYNAIQNAATETDAINIASEVFGSRAGSTMAKAIRDGSLAVGDLTAELLDSSETIAASAADTESAPEKWTKLINSLKTDIEPASKTLFDQVGETIEEIQPEIEKFAPQVVNGITNIIKTGGQVAKWALENKKAIAGVGIAIGGLVGTYKVAKNVIAAVKVVKGLKSLATQLKIGSKLIGGFAKAGKGVGTAFKLLTSPAGIAVMAIAAIVAGCVLLYKNWDKITAKGAEMRAKLAAIWQNLQTAAGNMVANISKQFPLLTVVMQSLLQSAQNIIGNIEGVFSGIIDFVTNVFTGNWSAAWQAVVDVFANIFGAIGNFVKSPINAVLSVINYAIDKINGISVTLPDWLPGDLGGKTLGFDLPNIPLLAAGGIATEPTLAMVGEGEEPEAILPISKLANLLKNLPSFGAAKMDAPGANHTAALQAAAVAAAAPAAKIAARQVEKSEGGGDDDTPGVDDLPGGDTPGGQSALAKLIEFLKNLPKPDNTPGGGGGGNMPAPGASGAATPTPISSGDNMNYSPVFNFYGNVTKEQAEQAGKISFAEFKRQYQRMKAEERRKKFSPEGV
jgi:hypothetical protein